MIVLNELFGASLETPWSATNTQYRTNVMTLMRTLAERGARPMLLISSEPYTEGEARAWWVEAARYGDLVQEVYFNARTLYKQGTIIANRRLRIAFRRAITNFTSIGIPATKVGIALGFQTGRGAGGREGLQPPRAWFETVKWQALAARQVARELRFGSIVSWGWGSYNGATADDKREAACVYLWTRDPRLCNGPEVAGERFNASLTDGQIRLSAGTQCTLGARRIAASQLGALQRVTSDRDVAFSALLARIAESAYASVKTVDVLAAERRVIALRFRGSRGAYASELRRAGANVTIARGVLADELRRLQLEARLRGGRPSSTEVFAFYSGYPELLVRRIQTKPAAPWLGRRRSGLALQALAPATVFAMPAGRWIRVAAPDRVYSVRAFGDAAPLASVPLPAARPTISAALADFSRRAAFEAWTHGRQEYVLQRAICRADDLPTPSGVRLTSYLPFLALSGG